MTNNLSDFQTILWPAVKTSNVGFYKKPSAGFASGSVISAPFTRSGAGRKVIDASGNLVDAAANVPAWTFPIGGSSSGCPYLSFLPSVENLLTYSEDFTTTWSTAASASVTANTVTSPDGTTNADTISLAAVTASRVFQLFTLANSTTYTLGCFFKNDSLSAGETFIFQINNGQIAPNNFEMVATVDLAQGTVVISEVGTAGTGISGTATGGIVPIIDGWYFVYVTATTGTGAGTASAGVQIISSNARQFYAWGAMLKEGSYISPLDYVPTTTAAVTRSVDRVTNITDLQTDGYLPTDTEGSIMLQLSSTGDVAGGFEQFLFRDGSSNIQFKILFANNAGVLYNQLNTENMVSLAEKELARYIITWNGTALNLYYNGFLAYSYTHSSSLSVVQFINAFTRASNGLDIKMLNFAPTALTANQAEAASSWPSFELMATDLNYN